MLNNEVFTNKKFPQQNEHQRNKYRNKDRNNFFPNNNINKINLANNRNTNYNINTINMINNPNRNHNININNIIKNNNYINKKNNSTQLNPSKNIESQKQFKNKQHNQIYLEGDFNGLINNQNNQNRKYSFLNDNKQKRDNINNILNKQNNNNNFIKRKNPEKIKNNRGLPRKSPIPVPKGFMTGKYINNDNMSYISKKSNNSNNISIFTVNSHLINNNYSISNLSQISGYSNNSYNNNQINLDSIINNEHLRAYSNNIQSSNTQKQNNKNNFIKNNNISIPKNKSNNNNLLNKQNKISSYIHKENINNYFNNNNFENTSIIKKPKYISKSPNIQGKDYLSYTIKRNISHNNININQNNYNIFNNSEISNASNIRNENLNLFNIKKLGYKTSSNFGSFYNNINFYDNYNDQNNKKANKNLNINTIGRPVTSHSHINKISKANNKINIIRNRININMIKNKNIQFGSNSNDILSNNYNSSEINFNQRQKMILNNNQKLNNNNFIEQYHSHKDKRDYSSNFPFSRINIDKNNNGYGANFNNNMNQMVNLHIINKGQIINNNYNNIGNNTINNMNNVNNTNNLYIYKYDISQKNILQGKYHANSKEKSNNNRKSNNNVRNNNINKGKGLTNDKININYSKLMNFNNIKNINNNVYDERQINHKNNKKGIKIRNNSASGAGVSGELNNLLYQGNYNKKINNIINTKKIDPNKKYNISNNKKNLNYNINTSINNFKIHNQNPLIKQIKKIHHFTHVGFNGEKDKDFNQDIAFLEKNFAGNNSFLYFGVCDGHGVEGHEVSSFIKDILPKELSKSLYNKDILTNDKNLKKKIYNIIGQTFIKVNEKLINNELINSIFSGTTCVSVIYSPQKLICANIGDSRAVLGRFEKNLKKWVAINLSRDHKPTEEDEARRIYIKGGRIKPFIDEETGEEVGPQRVWVKDDEVPGLAMTRSFGDRVASIAGTICIPEIKEYFFNEGDKFLILASDGVWEFIHSDECINIIGNFYFNNKIEECCEFLYNESRKRWIKVEEVVDDITMILVFFE